MHTISYSLRFFVFPPKQRRFVPCEFPHVKLSRHGALWLKGLCINRHDRFGCLCRWHELLRYEYNTLNLQGSFLRYLGT